MKRRLGGTAYQKSLSSHVITSEQKSIPDLNLN
jgi:hypothetical protein